MASLASITALSVFTGGKLEELLVEDVLLDLSILFLEESVKKFMEPEEGVSRASLAFRSFKIVVTLGVGAVVRLNTKFD